MKAINVCAKSTSASISIAIHSFFVFNSPYILKLLIQFIYVAIIFNLVRTILKALPTKGK